jgi:hypothetical protein
MTPVGRARVMRLPAIWRVRYDLAWMKLFLWIAGSGVTGEPKPEVHACLWVLYHQLADAHEARGNAAAARRLRRIAGEHGPPPEPPPAAAMGMAVPRTGSRTEVRGKSMPPPPSRKHGEGVLGPTA